jgi:hypothetical protein
MYQIRLPIRRYQNLASIAAVVGFLFGVAIPLYGFATGLWTCPFGDHITHKAIFGLLSGVLGALLLGNLAAVALILIAKYRKLLSRHARNCKR